MWNDGTLVELKWYRFGLLKTLQWLPVALRINPKLLPSPARPIPDSCLITHYSAPPFRLVQSPSDVPSHLCWLGVLDTQPSPQYHDWFLMSGLSSVAASHRDL